MEKKRRPLLAANWKMYKTLSEMEKYLSSFLDLVAGIDDRDILLAPNYTCLNRMVELLNGSNVKAAAQNMFYKDEGAFTGEVSPKMLLDIGVDTVIIGHSERRHIFHEDDELINKKVSSAISHGMNPVFCIGETLEEREAGETSGVLENQIRFGLKGLKDSDIPKIVIAYEPVWAIGTGKTASLEQIQEAHRLVRDRVAELAGEDIAENLRILYGGSVKPENVKDIMSLDDVDGALVGGASLEPESFAKIVKFEDN